MLTALLPRLPFSVLLLPSIALLLSSPAFAQSAREIQIAAYALSFGPETQRSADGRRDRNYLAQIRFQGMGRAKPVATPARRNAEALATTQVIARSKDNTEIALSQVVALESALWKRAHWGVMIADNLLAAPLQKTRAWRASSLAYGPQPVVLPQPLAQSPERYSLLAACEVETAPTVTLVRSQASEPTQSELPRRQVTPAQDRPAESC